MTYSYENLGADRFQEICQTILSVEYFDLQCLPVGQPDGGRDALLRTGTGQFRKDTVVYQVKYSKNPKDKVDRDSVSALIKSEGKKIKNLVARGLKKYYLMTNISGTSHQDAGTIDKIDKELSDAFGIDCFCFWRDELDRRIDANSSIKWSYPDILKGSDLLEALYRDRLGSEHDRRLAAIRAYLAYQYRYDSQLKFKQVDLDKGILDLFVDVPAMAVGPKNPQEWDKWRADFQRSPVFESLLEGSHSTYDDPEDRIGAVESLSNADVARGLPRVVIEGAPGQGKSTVTQFLCQLHRMILLDKSVDLRRTPERLRPSEVRLPMRIDLRDYATWIGGKSPFVSADSSELSVAKSSPALESFIAAQISSQAGGLSFTPDDLLAFASHSALLIVLDGFDEVADVTTRNRLVQEISDASARFEGNSISNQVIVTSRPAAFANSPGFPRDDWQYIQITPLSKSNINAYAEKWISAQSLDQIERRDILSVLEEKLEFPHVRDLARNPMQLAILLALISTQGASLPDKRTALYDRYVDIFFNRESEKSKVVRDKRDLLIDLHRYLAWVLQVEAESDSKAGNISEKRLREVLCSYLEKQGHETSLIDKLFVGMVERVVALVSRVQGTFEFEVQPLREYFAARYLYDTAPHVPIGSDISGSITDRFDALARNAYWFNVTRFYCGCYSTGELSSLIDGLSAIAQTEAYENTSFAGDLTITLLSDYVFSQQPRLVSRLTTFAIEGANFRQILARAYEDDGQDAISLPEGSGREQFFLSALEEFENSEKHDTSFAAARLVRTNTLSKPIEEIWSDSCSKIPIDQRAYSANYLGVIENLSISELQKLQETCEVDTLRMAAYRDRFDFLDAEGNWRKFIDLSLDGDIIWYGLSPKGVVEKNEFDEGVLVQQFVAVLGSLGSLNSARHHDGQPFGRLSREFGHVVADSLSIPIERRLPLALDTAEMAMELRGLELTKSGKFVQSGFSFLELVFRDYGFRPLIVDAAIALIDWMAPGPVAQKGCLQGQFAEIRKSSGRIAFWRTFLQSDDPSDTSLVKLRCFVEWVREKHFKQCLPAISDIIESLSQRDFEHFYRSFGNRYRPYSPPVRKFESIRFEKNDLKGVGQKCVAVIWQMLDSDAQTSLFEQYIIREHGDEQEFRDVRAAGAAQYAEANPSFWPEALRALARTYQDESTPHASIVSFNTSSMPIDIAKEVLKSQAGFPLRTIRHADRIVSANLGTKVVPVGDVAKSENWFPEVS